MLLRPALIAPALLALGCAAPLTGPAAGGAPWTELSSPHFTMHTDLRAADAGRLLGEIEDVYAMFKSVAFPSEVDPRDRIDVTDFARIEDYRELGPGNSDAYFEWNSPNELEPAPMMVMQGKLDGDKRRILQHELTHFFVRQSLGGVPVWLNEGLAEYYSTLKGENGYAYFGLPRPDRGVTTSKIGLWGAAGSGWYPDQRGIMWVPLNDMPGIGRLVSQDYMTFHQWGAPDSTPLAKQTAARRMTANYVGAWGLVHVLHNGPEEYRRRYAALSILLRRGRPFGLAWRAAFGYPCAGTQDHPPRRERLATGREPPYRGFVKKSTKTPKTEKPATTTLRDEDIVTRPRPSTRGVGVPPRTGLRAGSGNANNGDLGGNANNGHNQV